MSETTQDAVLRAQAAAIDKRFGEAEGICNDILARTPDEASALALKGMLVSRGPAHAEALALVQRAVELRPDVGPWQSNLALLHRQDCRMEEALRCAEAAVRLQPDNPDGLVTLSLVLTDLGNDAEAMAFLLRAVGVAPEHANAHLALAQNLLATGEFAAGWREYEWRNKTEAGLLTMPAATSAAWNGMNLPNGKLLVVGDQGYGDTIQFARYLPAIAKRCEAVILACSPELAPILRDIEGVESVCTEWAQVPPHAAYTRLSSAPYLFYGLGHDHHVVVPYLTAPRERIVHWKRHLAGREEWERFRVGLAWAGRPTHPNDRRRSLPLSMFAPLGQIPGVTFVLLHPKVSDAEMALAQELFPELSAPLLGDFGDTAGLLENLDLVITVDTAVAHLAGGLGVDTFILLSQAPDWRWMREHNDSHWYPTVRLFRQPKPGDWAPVIAEVERELRTLVHSV